MTAADKIKAAKQEALVELKHVYLIQFFTMPHPAVGRKLTNQVITFTSARAYTLIYQGMTDDERGLVGFNVKVRDAIIHRLNNIPLNNINPIRLFGLEIYRISVSHA